MIKILKAIILLISSLLIMATSCDHGPRGCTDKSACNYDLVAIEEDGSCNYPEENYDCHGTCLGEIDCAGVCGGGAERDCCGLCDDVSTNDPPENNNGDCLEQEKCGCTDPTKCNYNPDAIYDDNSCAVDLSQYGGSSNGTDCEENCGGLAVEDACGICVGGQSTTSGKSWIIGIDATVILSDSSRLFDSARIGASIYAEDGYNNENIEEANCVGCYIDFTELCGHADSLCFYFPHDEWEGEIDTIFTNGYDFDRDIRENDLYKLYSEGFDWEAEITIPSESMYIDSLLLDFIFIEGIESCQLIIQSDYIGEYEIQNQRIELEIGSHEIINLKFSVSDICFSYF
jgi:hypothetical protein